MIEGTVAEAGQGSEVVSLQAVNLRDGTVSSVARFHNNSGGSITGWGWHEESTAIANSGG